MKSFISTWRSINSSINQVNPLSKNIFIKNQCISLPSFISKKATRKGEAHRCKRWEQQPHASARQISRKQKLLLHYITIASIWEPKWCTMCLCVLNALYYTHITSLYMYIILQIHPIYRFFLASPSSSSLREPFSILFILAYIYSPLMDLAREKLNKTHTQTLSFSFWWWAQRRIEPSKLREAKGVFYNTLKRTPCWINSSCVIDLLYIY